jgi:hypothetical protein
MRQNMGFIGGQICSSPMKGEFRRLSMEELFSSPIEELFILPRGVVIWAYQGITSGHHFHIIIHVPFHVSQFPINKMV